MQNKLLLVYAIIITILFSLLIGPQMIALLLVWFVIVLYALKHQKSQKTKNIITIVAIAYPLIEYGIKLMIVYDLIPYSWEWLNRVEHAVFSGSVTLLLYFIITALNITKNKWAQVILILGILNLFGVANEVLEFILREFVHLRKDLYYPDTIYDLVMNLLASSFVLALLYIRLPKVVKRRV